MVSRVVRQSETFVQNNANETKSSDIGGLPAELTMPTTRANRANHCKRWNDSTVRLETGIVYSVAAKRALTYPRSRRDRASSSDGNGRDSVQTNWMVRFDGRNELSKELGIVLLHRKV